jgi:predicted phosphodiesterase
MPNKGLIEERKKVGTPLIQQFKQAGNQTIARVLHKEYPDLWITLDTARSWVRYRRGAMGKENRGKFPESERELPTEAVDPFGKLPSSLIDLTESEPYILECNRCLVLADVHIPYHHEQALNVALHHGYNQGIDSVVLLGDLLDFYSASSYVTDPSKRNLPGELEAGRQFLQVLRDTWPDAKIIFKAGNHEERWERYLFCRAPDVIGVPDFELSTILRLEDLNIEWLDRMRHVRIDHLNLVHGHEFGQSAYSPVNAARGLFLRSTAIAMCGHWHQTSMHAETTMDDEAISCWSLGTLGDLHPQYKRYNARWNHGFAIVDSADGFVVRNHRIIKGRVF